MKTKPLTTEHNLSFDILRIMAAFSVVVLHTCSKYLMLNDVNSLDFKIANFINSLSRFGVPIFVMISGAIFLSENKSITISKIWKKHILRLIIVYSVWSFAYYVFQSLYFWQFDFWNHGILRTIIGCVYSSNHFWFIFMIVDLYALIPILRQWLHSSTSKSTQHYFIFLFFVFQILRTTISILVDKSLVHKISEMTTILELSGYIGYFVLGYYLVHTKLSKKIKVLIYALVPLGIIINYLVSAHMSIKSGTYSAGIYDSFGLFTFINVVAVFIFITDLSQKIKLTKQPRYIIKNLASDTLGIYLMHIAFLDFFTSKNIIIGQFSTFIGIILLSCLCFAVCCVFSALLRRIPFIGHYIC